MKTITINSQDFVTSTASTLEIKLSKLPKNIKVVDAMLNFKFASNPTFPARIDYYNSLAPSQCVWQNVDKVSSSTEYLLNISDELQDCLNKKADSIIFKTSTASTFQKSGELKISAHKSATYRHNCSLLTTTLFHCQSRQLTMKIPLKIIKPFFQKAGI